MTAAGDAAPPVSRLGVKTVRGPFVELTPHPDHCETAEQLHDWVGRLRGQNPDVTVVADLFAGAGGLSLGLEQAGLTTVFAVDHDERATKTHAHHFGGMSVDWDLSDPALVDETGELLRSLAVDVIAGGPPCQPFSKAGRSMMRHLVREGIREAHDTRRDLWRSYLEIIRIARPRAVLMENVPDMALDREMFILRSMVLALESMGYSVEERVVDTRLYGVPQFRHRLILVAMADGMAFEWPAPSPERPTVQSAIGDLPPVEGGDRPEGGAHGFWDYPESADRSPFARLMRDGVPRADRHRIYDHITRPVRPDDLEAFMLMDPGTRYSDLDPKYKRYRDDIFDDKYKRLDPDDVSRTITAHIAKDGYWYIHPTQPRTITVREAARLQTFPDWFRFSGPPSAAFRQIGNAVPPLLGRFLGQAVREALSRTEPAPHSTRQVSATLSGFLRESPPIAVPWLASASRWGALCGEILLDRAAHRDVRQVWPLLSRWSTPALLLENRASAEFLGRRLGREERMTRLLSLAQRLETGECVLSDDGLTDLVQAGTLMQAQADIAILIATEGNPDDCEEPILVTRGVLRPVARFNASSVNVQNKLSDGRIAVASMVGYGPTSREAHLALIEIASRVCRPQPDCGLCPLRRDCRSREVVQQQTSIPFESKSEQREQPHRFRN